MAQTGAQEVRVPFGAPLASTARAVQPAGQPAVQLAVQRAAPPAVAEDLRKGPVARRGAPRHRYDCFAASAPKSGCRGALAACPVWTAVPFAAKLAVPHDPF